MVTSVMERTDVKEITDPKVAILVVDYGTPGDIERLIESADIHEPGRPWYIWRNRHPNKLQGLSMEFLVAHANVEVYEHHENVGHGKGINGLARMLLSDPSSPASDYLFVLNPDTLFTEPIIDRMVAFLLEDEKRAIVAPKQLDSRGYITHGGFFGTNEAPKMAHWKVHDPRNVVGRENKEAIMVAGAAFVISVPDWQEFDGLLETHHYYNETWLCYHLRAHEREVWYMGEVSMIHEWHQSTPIGGSTTDAKMPEDRELFRKKCREHNPPIACD